MSSAVLKVRGTGAFEWIDTMDAAHAFNKVGLFGNQNNVCQPRAAKCRHTVKRLKAVFTGCNG